jgi:hypothetical protein
MSWRVSVIISLFRLNAGAALTLAGDVRSFWEAIRLRRHSQRIKFFFLCLNELVLLLQNYTTGSSD